MTITPLTAIEKCDLFVYEFH